MQIIQKVVLFTVAAVFVVSVLPFVSSTEEHDKTVVSNHPINKQANHKVFQYLHVSSYYKFKCKMFLIHIQPLIQFPNSFLLIIQRCCYWQFLFLLPYFLIELKLIFSINPISKHWICNGHCVNSCKQLSPRLTSEIILHGFLLWTSMGFLMPLAILAVRMSNREQCGRRLRILIYIHAILQASTLLFSLSLSVNQKY